MGLLQSGHTINLYVAGTDVYGNLINDTLTLTQSTDSTIDRLEFSLADPHQTLSVPPWAEVILSVDGDNLFGGYAVRPIPREDKGEGRIWQVVCEGYERRLHHTDEISGFWANTPAGTILQQMFTKAGVYDFDTNTYVQAGPTVTFGVREQVLAQALDRLATACSGYFWRVDGDKRVHFASLNTGTATAPYGIADIASADWQTTFPPLAGITVDYNDLFVNRVVVKGGQAIGTAVTEVFTGDGVTDHFVLSARPIHSIIYVEVDGELVSFGTMWVHSFNDYTALIDYSDGVVWFGTPPADGSSIRVQYRQLKQVSYTASDTVSFDALGFYITYTVHDNSISSQEKAQEIAQGILDAFGGQPIRVRFTTRRLWLKPGQEIAITYPTLGISGVYPIREVTTRLVRGEVFEQQVVCGAKTVRAADIIRERLGGYGGAGRPAVYGPGGHQPTQDGTTQEMTVAGIIKLIDPRTTFSV